MKKEKGVLQYEIRNIGGVGYLDVALTVGVNIFRGENGAGKSSAWRAVARAGGSQIVLERKDGSEHGTVQGPGVLLSVRKVVSSSGTADVGLADVGPLGRLVDPGIKDTGKAARARIRALVELLDLGLGDGDDKLLCGGDDALVMWLGYEIQLGDDLTQLAEKVRVKANEFARIEEARGAGAEQGKTAALREAGELLSKLGGRDAMLNVPLDEVSSFHLEMVRGSERLRGEFSAREQLSRRQEEIRSTLGDAPKRAEALTKVEEARSKIVAAEGRIQYLEAELLAASSKLRFAEQLGQAANERLDGISTQHDLWMERRKLLDQPLEGATASDVEAFDKKVAEAAADVERAVQSEHVRDYEQTAGECDVDLLDATREAARYRKIAGNVPEALGKILAEAGAGNLAVVGGRIHRRVGGELMDFETRSSTGERISAALEVVATVYRGKVVPLDGAFWTALDPEHRRLFAQVAVELGLFVITEEPTDGGLRVEHEGGGA